MLEQLTKSSTPDCTGFSGACTKAATVSPAIDFSSSSDSFLQANVFAASISFSSVLFLLLALLVYLTLPDHTHPDLVADDAVKEPPCTQGGLPSSSITVSTVVFFIQLFLPLFVDLVYTLLITLGHSCSPIWASVSITSFCPDPLDAPLSDRKSA